MGQDPPSPADLFTVMLPQQTKHKFECSTKSAVAV